MSSNKRSLKSVSSVISEISVVPDKSPVRSHKSSTRSQRSEKKPEKKLEEKKESPKKPGKCLPYSSVIGSKFTGRYNIFESEERIMALKRHSYNKIFACIKNLIKLTCKAREKICLYEIPTYLYGEEYPHINIKSCSRYLIQKIINWNSYIRVAFEKPNILLLDWSN